MHWGKSAGWPGGEQNVKTNLAGNIIGAWTILVIPMLLRIRDAEGIFPGVLDPLSDGYIVFVQVTSIFKLW